MRRKNTSTMTEKDYEVYKFIIDYIKENGYAPSYREIREGVGTKSIDSVLRILWKLEYMGKIKIKKKTPRAIKVVGYEFVKIK